MKNKRKAELELMKKIDICRKARGDVLTVAKRVTRIEKDIQDQT